MIASITNPEESRRQIHLTHPWLLQVSGFFQSSAVPIAGITKWRRVRVVTQRQRHLNH